MQILVRNCYISGRKWIVVYEFQKHLQLGIKMKRKTTSENGEFPEKRNRSAGNGSCSPSSPSQTQVCMLVLDIYYCTATYPPCGTCQFPIIYNVATCNVSSYYRAPLEMETIIITEGVGSVFGRWRRRDAITQTPAETDHHSSLTCQIKVLWFFQREKMSVTLAFKCFQMILSILSILQYVGCLSNVGNFLNLISVNYWINFILQQMVCLVGKWMSELYTWQNCIVWCKNALKTLNTILNFYARNDFCTDN